MGLGAGGAVWVPPLTGTAPDWTTILRGALPTGIVVVTALLVRSTTETSFDFSLVTYAKWLSEVAVIQCGIVPTLTVPVAALLAGSNRSSSPGPCATTMPSLPSGVNNGWCGEAPVGIWVTI